MPLLCLQLDFTALEWPDMPHDKLMDIVAFGMAEFHSLVSGSWYRTCRVTLLGARE